MVGRRHAVRIIAHQVRDDDSDSSLLVITEDGRTAGRTGAKFKRPIGVVLVEGLFVQTVRVVNFEVSMLKQGDMSRLLSGDAFTD